MGEGGKGGKRGREDEGRRGVGVEGKEADRDKGTAEGREGWDPGKPPEGNAMTGTLQGGGAKGGGGAEGFGAGRGGGTEIEEEGGRVKSV